MEMDSSALSETGLEETCVFMDDLFDEDELADLQRSLEAALAAPAPPEPTKKTKSSGSTRKKLCKGSSAPIVISFGKLNGDQKNSEKRQTRGELTPEEEAAVSEALRCSSSTAGRGDLPKAATAPPGKKNSRIRPPEQTYDHIIAERKRRELLGQRFSALSAIVPGIKKMDKNSVLGSTINYLKHLQEQVQILEEKAENQSRDWGVLVRKSLIDGFGKNRGREDMNEEEEEQALPAVEARIKEHEVVVRIQCEIQKGVLANLLREVEDLHLAVVTANLTALGGLALDITINAEMEKEFNATGIEVATRLGAAIQRLAHRSPCEE